MTNIQASVPIPRDLGDGLVLRRATLADAEALVAFNLGIHTHDDTGEPDERVAAWTRDLIERPHPTFHAGDFTIVEDTRAGSIVSSMNLISQTWSYGGVEFKVGRPELVGTHPDYRSRGLVRAQFEVVHGWSAQRGELLQAITGIPYYYRLFGYEMALDLGGGRSGFKPHIPKLGDGQAEPYRIRPALESDLPFIAESYRHGCQRSLVSCVWDQATWRYELLGKSPQNVNRAELRVIEGLAGVHAGERVGYLAHPFNTWGPMMVVTAYELLPGVSWAEVTPAVIRYLQAVGEDYVSENEVNEPFEGFGFWLGREHPVYQTIPERLPRLRKPYAWFLRLPDLPAFLRRIAPVLESRLSGSPLVGHTGEIKISFYRSGFRLAFEAGKLAEVSDWKPAPQGHSGDASFPDLTFLQLVFGYRSLEELKYAFADCIVNGDQAIALLNSLFPKQASSVWPIS